jgi:hypothetical protein
MAAPDPTPHTCSTNNEQTWWTPQLDVYIEIDMGMMELLLPLHRCTVGADRGPNTSFCLARCGNVQHKAKSLVRGPCPICNGAMAEAVPSCPYLKHNLIHHRSALNWHDQIRSESQKITTKEERGNATRPDLVSPESHSTR